MLVEIEGCKANPSIALLCKIAAAMGVRPWRILVNVASEPMVHLIDRDAIPVLWRGEKGGSAKLMAWEPAGRGYAGTLAMIRIR